VPAYANRRSRRLPSLPSASLLVAMTLALLLAQAGLGVMPCLAQTAAAATPAAQPVPSTLAFEAVSIHRDPSGSMNTHISSSNGRFVMENGSLKTLIRNCYDVLSFQFAGGPPWLDTEMYDITATTGSADHISDEQLKVMLRNLLADRFQFKFHWEPRQTSVYALIVAKGGAKLTVSKATKAGINTRKGSGRGEMIGTAEPISILAGNLGTQLGRFVVDKTGLTGAYDWDLVWDPDPTNLNPNGDTTNPSIFTAVQQQLGLRLVPEKAPVQTMIIDQAEKPSEN
jgi:uncharacterized protein (TIGR03435 family)